MHISVTPIHTSRIANGSNNTYLWQPRFRILQTRNSINVRKVKFFTGDYRFKLATILAIQYKLYHHIRYVWRGVDMSLARHISRCRKTESIVSLERGACTCAELQDISCYRGGKEAFQAKGVISTTSRRELSSSFIPFKASCRRKLT